MESYVKPLALLMLTVVCMLPLFSVALAARELHKKVSRGSVYFLTVGAIFLALLPLDLPLVVFLSTQGHEMIKTHATYKATAGQAITYASLIFIAIGMLSISKEIGRRTQQASAPASQFSDKREKPDR